jgi:hypothetical protein
MVHEIIRSMLDAGVSLTTALLTQGLPSAPIVKNDAGSRTSDLGRRNGRHRVRILVSPKDPSILR